MFSEGEVKSPYFLQVWWALAPCIFISYCCLCQCQTVCYYMPVPTTYHWNISFQKKCSSKYVVKNARNVTQFVWQVSLMFLLQLPLVSIQFDVPSRINGLISATCSIKSVWRFVFRYLWCQVNLIFFSHKQNILINSTSFMLCLSHKYIPNIILSSRKAYFWSHKAMIHVFNSSTFGFILKH